MFVLPEASPAGRMTWRTWSTGMLPLAILSCASLILGNKAYLYLSVASIQMLKVRSAERPTQCTDILGHKPCSSISGSLPFCIKRANSSRHCSHRSHCPRRLHHFIWRPSPYQCWREHSTRCRRRQCSADHAFTSSLAVFADGPSQLSLPLSTDRSRYRCMLCSFLRVPPSQV